jgi:hypothetical protein
MARDNDREIEAFMPKTGIGQKVNSTLWNISFIQTESLATKILHLTLVWNNLHDIYVLV